MAFSFPLPGGKAEGAYPAVSVAGLSHRPPVSQLRYNPLPRDGGAILHHLTGDEPRFGVGQAAGQLLRLPQQAAQPLGLFPLSPALQLEPLLPQGGKLLKLFPCHGRRAARRCNT